MEHIDIALKNIDPLLMDQQLDTIIHALYQYGYNGEHEAATEAMGLVDALRDQIPE